MAKHFAGNETGMFLKHDYVCFLENLTDKVILKHSCDILSKHAHPKNALFQSFFSKTLNLKMEKIDYLCSILYYS